MEDTRHEYVNVTGRCRRLFEAKLRDYGPSWSLFRLPSLTDQILIKALRIRSLEEKGGVSKVPEGRDVEYVGIVNYCTIALMRIWFPEKVPNCELALSAGVAPISDTEVARVMSLYDTVHSQTLSLMLDKNHDYGEAWRAMRLGSITDQILVKVARLRQIEGNLGVTTVSEGADAHYSDMLNYAIFALIQLGSSLNASPE